MRSCPTQIGMPPRAELTNPPSRFERPQFYSSRHAVGRWTRASWSVPWDTGIMVASRTLFERDWPSGFHYREDFITDADERVLLEAIADVAFADFEMRGVVARRRVAFFGQSVRSGSSWAASSVPVALARKDCPLVRHRFRRVRHGPDQ